MKVLMQARVNLFTAPGGDTVQILKTAEHLDKHGVAVDVIMEPVRDYRPYDVVHLFNVTRIQETYCFARDAKQHGKPVVLSTIYWDNEETERLADVGWRKYITGSLSLDQIERLKGVWRMVGEREVTGPNLQLVLKGFIRLQRETVRLVDHFLPNSEVEMALFRKKLADGRMLPYSVVPNGVDVPPDTIARPDNYEELDGCILCVGRIDGRKNQLNLVRAMRDSTIPLVFVGKAAPNHMAYFRRVEAEATPSTYFLGQIGLEEVVHLYRRAKVHCLPSWYETPGLASLEAAAQGCNVVVTERGSTREYFGDHAFYCEPDSVDSIRAAVDRAYATPADDKLRSLVRTRYTWAEAARITASAYQEVVRRARASA